MKLSIPLPLPLIEAFCQRWKIAWFALFGSVLREDFDPGQSDIDILVTHSEDGRWSLLDRVDMLDELKAIFGRDVDLVTTAGLAHGHNALLRSHILATAQTVYGDPQ